jgi:hypothetical protein
MWVDPTVTPGQSPAPSRGKALPPSGETHLSVAVTRAESQRSSLTTPGDL